MEKLIIKNFGPISDVEIELKEYVLLIGDTSTGKSIIAKLICIFQEFLLGGVDDIEGFRSKLSNHNIDFLNEKSEISYYLENYHIIIKKQKINRNASPEFIKYQLSILKKTLEEIVGKNKVEKIKEEQLEKLLPLRLDIKNLPLYIPAERMFFSMLGRAIAGLWANEINIANSYKKFAAHYEIAKENISELEYPDLKFTYHREEEKEYITCENEEKKIDLKYTSSGIQAILPLIIVLNNLKKRPNNYDLKQIICIEEPEISLFPHRQKSLLEYIISIVNKVKNSRVVITTHSPYILSAFNNLILAHNTAVEKKYRKKDVEEIISKDKWIDFNKVSAYEVKDGGVVSLIDEEMKELNINAIDEVSNLLMEETDALIDIRYEE